MSLLLYDNPQKFARKKFLLKLAHTPQEKYRRGATTRVSTDKYRSYLFSWDAVFLIQRRL
jgi:hypothetical protein